MRIAYIVPGSGNTFYCQNCFRDLLMVRALRKLGHDVVMIPMYLPLFEDSGAASPSAPVFYGAVSLYLKHTYPSFRRAPHWVSRLLDARPFLNLAARKAGSTRARGHEDMTMSMLRGESGGQAEELERLVAWLEGQPRFDVVHLSNALLLGLAGELGRRLQAAVVCSLQDEDTWVDAMQEEDARRLWGAMAERAAGVGAFISVSRYYADYMRSRLGLQPERLRLVPVGIDLDGYRAAPLSFDPPVIGYLSRIAEAEGFGLLVDAFLMLKQDPQLKTLKLMAIGGQTGDNRRFVEEQRRKLDSHGAVGALTIIEAFDKPHRLDFLSKLTLLSVPALKGEAFGTYLIEAMASGVPVVQPALGGFPEIVNATGGGILYEPNTAVALAAALRSLLLNRQRTRELGRHGREIALRDFGVEKAAGKLVEVYQSVAGQ